MAATVTTTKDEAPGLKHHGNPSPNFLGFGNGLVEDRERRENEDHSSKASFIRLSPNPKLNNSTLSISQLNAIENQIILSGLLYQVPQ